MSLSAVGHFLEQFRAELLVTLSINRNVQHESKDEISVDGRNKNLHKVRMPFQY